MCLSMDDVCRYGAYYNCVDMETFLLGNINGKRIVKRMLPGIFIGIRNWSSVLKHGMHGPLLVGLCLLDGNLVLEKL